MFLPRGRGQVKAIKSLPRGVTPIARPKGVCYGADSAPSNLQERFVTPVSSPFPRPVQAVFFDLDGTLLQVEMKSFIPTYVRTLAESFSEFAPPERFATIVGAAAYALLKKDDEGTTNQQLFLRALNYHLDIPTDLFDSRLAHFCDHGLPRLAPLIRPLPLARRILGRAFDQGLKVVLATNPVFPRPVVDARLAWGEIADFPFDLISSYENSRFCKPNPRYFSDLLDHFGLAPDQCLMVGNDTEHDLAAGALGIPTFLVDTWMIDRTGGDYRADYRGSHLDLFRFLGTLDRQEPLAEC